MAASHRAAAERKLWRMLHFPFQPNQGSAGTSIDCQAPNSRRDDGDWSDGGSLGVPEFSSTESRAAEVLLFTTILGRSTVLAAKAALDGSFLLYRSAEFQSLIFISSRFVTCKSYFELEAAKLALRGVLYLGCDVFLRDFGLFIPQFQVCKHT